MPRVFETASFERDIRALSLAERQQIEVLKDRLESGFSVGKPLRYPFFREKKIQGKRVYFLVYRDHDVVLLVAVSDKKAQQETIEKIIELLPEFKKLVGKLT